MSQKRAKCPYCGREMPNELGSEETQVDEIVVKCPRCGSTRNWKDGKRYAAFGVIQRYYCRDCFRRFSKR